jgi:hypothetical protein
LELKNSHQRRKQVIPFSSSPFPLIVVHT